MQARKPISFLGTIALLFRYAKVRRAARSARQKELFSSKHARSGTAGGDDLGWLATLAGLFFAFMIHWLFAETITPAMHAVATGDLEKRGLLVVSEKAYTAIAEYGRKDGDVEARKERAALDDAIAWSAAADLPREREGTLTEGADRVQAQYRDRGIDGFVAFPSGKRFLQNNDHWTPATYGVLALGIFTWIFMLVCQGEGLELDIQRRRHPVWEWLLSHPIRPAA